MFGLAYSLNSTLGQSVDFEAPSELVEKGYLVIENKQEKKGDK